MRVLITGGFGYLGGRLAQCLAGEVGYDILLGTRQVAESPSWLSQVNTVQTDWCSSIGLEQICTGVNAIVHLAGMNAQDCVADPVAALEFNAVATARLLRAAIRKGVRRFISVSTAHIYGSPLSGIITEETCPTSLHPYATSHRAGEDVVRAAHKCAEIEGVVIRLSNTFGEPAHKDVNCWMLLVNDLCRQAVTTQRMVLNSSGGQRRDFMPLTDACDAIKYLLELPAGNLGGGVFNLGSGWAPTIFEITERVGARFYAVTGRRPEILSKTGEEIPKPAIFDYKIEKLIATGFGLRGNQNVDKEIDRLIQFCLKQFA